MQTAAGVRYTRDGQFTTDAEGNLTDAEGDLVLGPNGQSVKLRADGTVSASALGVFEIAGAEKQGENLFTGNPTGVASGTARAGFLEESGVNSARVMTQMITSFRSLEADQKSIQTIDETLDESAGQVGSIS